MRAVAIFTEQPETHFPNQSIGEIELDGKPVYCGVIDMPLPQFDPNDFKNREMVLIKVKAFSCNFRDKALILLAATSGRKNSYYTIGSEFVGEIIDVGSEVHHLCKGDRVIADGNYIGGTMDNEGIPTNHASKEYQVLRKDKLLKIPSTMPDEVAAGFTIGAQTVFSMIRKLTPQPGANILVTSVRSNTSLFALNALLSHNMNVYATSTSLQNATELHALGVKKCFQVNIENANSEMRFHELNEFIKKEKGFDYIIDPFFDLHLEKIVDFMNPGGKYITCGFWGQYQATIQEEIPQDFMGILKQTLAKNLTIIGNCLGTTDDLLNALRAYETGKFDVKLDSTYFGQDVEGFLYQTFVAKNRFGRVIYRYE